MEKAVTKVPVVPSYSSTAPSKASATNRSPLGPKAMPAGWISPPPRNGTKVLTKAPVVPSYSRTAASAEGKVLPLLPTNSSPWGPKARPLGLISPPLPFVTKVLTKAPVLPLYSRIVPVDGR